MDFEYRFYRGQQFGSEFAFNPFSSLVNYGLDPLQVPRSFDDDNLSEDWDELVELLTHPDDAIERDGTYHDFVNRQILPISAGDLSESVELVPNYGLHLIGGGLIYRKNVEWFRYHGYRYPRTASAILVLASELIHEVMEKGTTPPDDPIADFYIFRPAGMLLFSSERFARFASRRLDLVEWSHQPMYSPERDQFINVGSSFATRPRFKKTGDHRFFFYFGLTNLLGASHLLGQHGSLSWGIGLATEAARRSSYEARVSAGVFWDRDGSLVASVVLNGTDNLAVRANLYPRLLFPRRWWSPGFYLAIDDDGAPGIGISIRSLGLAAE